MRLAPLAIVLISASTALAQWSVGLAPGVFLPTSTDKLSSSTPVVADLFGQYQDCKMALTLRLPTYKKLTVKEVSQDFTGGSVPADTKYILWDPSIELSIPRRWKKWQFYPGAMILGTLQKSNVKTTVPIDELEGFRAVRKPTVQMGYGLSFAVFPPIGNSNNPRLSAGIHGSVRLYANTYINNFYYNQFGNSVRERVTDHFFATSVQLMVRYRIKNF